MSSYVKKRVKQLEKQLLQLQLEQIDRRESLGKHKEEEEDAKLAKSNSRANRRESLDKHKKGEVDARLAQVQSLFNLRMAGRGIKYAKEELSSLTMGRGSDQHQHLGRDQLASASNPSHRNSDHRSHLERHQSASASSPSHRGSDQRPHLGRRQSGDRGEVRTHDVPQVDDLFVPRRSNIRDYRILAKCLTPDAVENLSARTQCERVFQSLAHSGIEGCNYHQGFDPDGKVWLYRAN